MIREEKDDGVVKLSSLLERSNQSANAIIDGLHTPVIAWDARTPVAGQITKIYRDIWVGILILIAFRGNELVDVILLGRLKL